MSSEMRDSSSAVTALRNTWTQDERESVGKATRDGSGARSFMMRSRSAVVESIKLWIYLYVFGCQEEVKLIRTTRKEKDGNTFRETACLREISMVNDCMYRTFLSNDFNSNFLIF